MDKRAWIGQLKRQVDKQGADNASWYVFWNDPDSGAQQNKSCGPGKVGEKAAEKLADKRHSELVTGTYQPSKRKEWATFETEYKKKIVARLQGRSKQSVEETLIVFKRIIKPNFMKTLTTEKIDSFIVERSKDPGIKGRNLAAATVNKDLRNIRTMLRVAHEWGYLAKVPKFRMLKESKGLPTFVPPEHFASIYVATSEAKAPNIPNVSAAQWWQALLTMAYMTGWRVGQLLALQWVDVDLESGTAITRADANGNKGKRDEKIPLHPVVIEHLRPLKNSFDDRVFPWNQEYRKLWTHLWIIQRAAVLPGHTPEAPKPLPQCGKNGWYGFHDFRRAFATCNAADMDLFELQKLMQHKSLATTQGYVHMATKLNSKVKGLFVPPVLATVETA